MHVDVHADLHLHDLAFQDFLEEDLFSVCFGMVFAAVAVVTSSFAILVPRRLPEFRVFLLCHGVLLAV